MALSKTGLKQRILNELQAKGFDVTNQHSKIADLAEAIANAVIDEITQNATVSTTVTGTCTCPAGSGSITGSGTGSIS